MWSLFSITLSNGGMINIYSKAPMSPFLADINVEDGVTN